MAFADPSAAAASTLGEQLGLGDPALRRRTTATDLNAAILSAQAGLGAGTGAVEPGGHCSPRHPTHFEPSSLELHGTL